MRRWPKSAVSGLVCLAFLSACGRLAAREQEPDLSGLLRSLSEAKRGGQVGSVEGFVYLIMPGVPTPLKDWTVELIPLSPTLEASVASAQERFARNGRAPLSAEALGRARQPIGDYLKQVASLGRGELILTAKTATQEPKFTFKEVPVGRWLIMAELPSKISVLLWAHPVTVVEGEVTRQSLNDGNIWLEGLKP